MVARERDATPRSYGARRNRCLGRLADWLCQESNLSDAECWTVTY